MTKFEFLGDLSRLIADLPLEDREQAMEYYEDYFADAGPEREQEIIRDFVSPAYIAEQLREASLQRQQEANNSTFQEEEKKAQAAASAAAAEKPAVFSRKLAAQAKKSAAQAVGAAPGQKPVSQTAAQPGGASGAPNTMRPGAPSAPPNMAQSGAPNTAQPGAAPAPSNTPQASAVPTPPPALSPAAQAAISSSAPQTPAQVASQILAQQADGSGSGNKMRNSIFQETTEEDLEKEKQELEMKKKTTVNIKSISDTTGKVDKKAARAAAKQRAAEEKAYNANRYSSSKKTMISVVMLITCPIWIAALLVILGLFAAGIGAVLACVALGIGSVVASVASLLLSLMSLFTAQFPNFVFTFGCALFLFSAGIGICYADFKIFTRVIPGAYFSVIVMIKSLKARIMRLALK